MRQSLGTIVETADGSFTLSHPEHGECYHSQAGALAEARDLYIEASGIAGRWQTAPRTPVSVLDVGLGLGYNAAATLTAWFAAANPPDLHLTSLEINPDLVTAMASGAAPWQANWSEPQLAACRALQMQPPSRGVDEAEAKGQWQAVIPHPRGAASAKWRIYIGDASALDLAGAETPGGYDYVWQDPFSPAKNPPLWSAPWFAKVAGCAADGCVLMTYSVARPVRDALTAAGWSWEKIPTTMKAKRHWLKAQYHLNSNLAPIVQPTK